MALRVVLTWIGLNLGALLLLAVVDVLRVAGKGLFRRGTKSGRLQKAASELG
jgi:hypothetical protein